MGLKISRCPRWVPRWEAGLMRWELNRREAAWRVEAGGCRLDRHPRDKPLGCLLVDARHDNWFRDFLARRSASPQMQGVRFEVEQDGPFQGEAILLDWKPKPMLILPED